MSISSNGAIFVQVDILLITVLSAGRRALLSQSAGSVQVDFNLTYAVADASHLASKVKPSAAWTSGFCYSNPQVGCTSVRIVASCTELTPCATPSSSPNTSLITSVPIGIVAGVVSALVVLLLIALAAVYWYRRRSNGSTVISSGPDGSEAAKEWAPLNMGGTLQTPTRGQQLLAFERAQEVMGSPAASPAEQFWTPRSTSARTPSRGVVPYSK